MKCRRLFLLHLLALFGCDCSTRSRGSLPDSSGKHAIILFMLPAYGLGEQIRAGNMGHAAIEFDGRLHDIGSLNGYAYTLKPSTGVRFWPFANADAAIAQIAGHCDSDGFRDSIVRFDVQITKTQEQRLTNWWNHLEQQMTDKDNRLYVWNGLQCASAVSESLHEAGIMKLTSVTPAGLCDLLRESLRNTAGPAIGKLAMFSIVQKPIIPRADSGSSLHRMIKWPAMFHAGERSKLVVDGPDGVSGTILWSDSDEFKSATSRFVIRPADAVVLARKANPVAVDAAGVQVIPNFLIGDWYHVESDHVIGQAALNGWYVNAKDGRVIYRSDRRAIRFDVFDGDRVALEQCDVRVTP